MSTPGQCPNCQTAHGESDLFCENCGYDFITGSLPSLDGNDAPVPTEVESSQPASPVGGPQILVDIEVSSDYFGHAVSETELQIPDPPPESAQLTFSAIEIHIGRTSESRGIHPDIDVAAITADPAVSSRHAVIRLGATGTLAITDLDSTNGTVIGDPAAEAVAANVAVPLEDDTWVYLGAWSRIRARVS